MRMSALSLVALFALTAACDDSRPTSLTDPVPAAPSTGTVAFLTVSEPDAPVGAVVTVTVNARQAASLARVGAFTARLRFDSTALAYVADRSASGTRAVNATAGLITAAGASPDGFPDGALVAVSLRVLKTGALATLALEIGELHGTDFGNHLSALDLRTQLYTSRR